MVWFPTISPMAWHFVFESLAYAVGFALYRRARAAQGDFLATPDRSSVIVAAVVGAAIGAKALGWIEDPAYLAAHWREPAFWLGGKTVLGALLGGTIAVEWTKARLGIRERTGDLFAIPLCAGMAIGRIGCFLAGLDDHTYGTPTTLLWGVNFGDGVIRHPTQLYEIAFLLALIALIRATPIVRRGDHYRLFLFSYCAWRVAVDFLKPAPTFAGLATLQWVALAAAVYYFKDVRLGRRSGTCRVEPQVDACFGEKHQAEAAADLRVKQLSTSSQHSARSQASVELGLDAAGESPAPQTGAD